MVAHACLKNELTEDEKYHSVMTWIKCGFAIMFYTIDRYFIAASADQAASQPSETSTEEDQKLTEHSADEQSGAGGVGYRHCHATLSTFHAPHTQPLPCLPGQYLPTVRSDRS